MKIYGLIDIPGIKQYIRPGTHHSNLGGPTYDIKVPSFDTTLWRYMDFAKFVSLLEYRALFFTRADKLDDPFEGTLSEVNKAIIQQGYKLTLDKRTSDTLDVLGIIGNAVKQGRRFTLINCWQASEHESEAMWKLYSGQGHGLAIRTDFKSLVFSFTDRVPDIIANVEYISYENQLIPPLNLYAPFLHKRVNFSHEQEVRAIIRCLNYKETDREDVREPDYSRDVCEVGISFGIDPGDLIQEVVVSPYAEPWMIELVQSVCRRYGINKPVRLSGMAKNPVW